MNKQSSPSAAEAKTASAATKRQTLNQSLPPGPDTNVKITQAYARMVAKDAYFWAWPLVNMYNRRLAFTQVKDIHLAGPLIQAPLNRFGMLTDYVVHDLKF